jgi:hypothetical protein
MTRVQSSFSFKHCSREIFEREFVNSLISHMEEAGADVRTRFLLPKMFSARLKLPCAQKNETMKNSRHEEHTMIWQMIKCFFL